MIAAFAKKKMVGRSCRFESSLCSSFPIPLLSLKLHRRYLVTSNSVLLCLVCSKSHIYILYEHDTICPRRLYRRPLAHVRVRYRKVRDNESAFVNWTGFRGLLNLARLCIQSYPFVYVRSRSSSRVRPSHRDTPLVALTHH